MSAVGLVLAVYIVGAVLVGGTDYALRLPSWLRVGFWIVGLATLIMVIRKWWIPAWRFRPSLTDVALRLEQTEDAKKAGLGGVLASGIELAARAHEEGVTGTLSEEVALDAARRLPAGRRIEVPTAFSGYPADIASPPPRLRVLFM